MTPPTAPFRFLLAGACLASGLSVASPLQAAPIEGAWTGSFGASPNVTAVAAAALSGYEAAADTSTDEVQIRDTRGNLLKSLPRSRFATQLPWMTLDASGDGPVGLTFSDSGRLLFIAVHDNVTPGDAQPGDAVLRYDTQTDTLTTYLRVELSPADANFPRVAMTHFKGRLYVGLPGFIRCYAAGRDDFFSFQFFATSIPGGATPVALAVDRTQNALLAAWSGTVQRSVIGSSSLTFTQLGTVGNIRDLALSEHFGGSANAGLYLLSSSTTSSAITSVPLAQARGTQPFAPVLYTGPSERRHTLAATCDGAMLTAGLTSGVSSARRIRDNSDTRLPFESWLANEIAQVTVYAKGLVSPDGEPPGWVIDADVVPSINRFHPASPDAAAWVVLMLLVNDDLNGDPNAKALVTTILERYAGLAADGIKPLRSADGIYWHWINPFTGGPKAGWGDSYATLSTMKIVKAAGAAAAYFPGDARIRAAARAIACGVKNWDSYLVAGPGVLYYLGNAAGGPTLSSASFAYNEGLLFVHEAAFYGGASSDTAYANWLNRSLWPTATFALPRPVTGDSNGSFQSAFVSQYSSLLIPDFRASSAWRTQMLNLRLSNMAWTDDFGPRWNTVFGAGTTITGYNADSLSNHPDDIAHFPSLMAFAAGTGAGDSGHVPAAAGAYQAYRTGARVLFKTGASMLYRRSNTQPTWVPNSAGLPDVALGALGMAELVKPGIIDRVLASPLVSCAACPCDLNGDGFVDDSDFVFFADFYNALITPGPFQDGDFNGDALCDDADFVIFAEAYNLLICP